MLVNPQSIDKFLQLLKTPKQGSACLVVSGGDHGVAHENISRYQFGETLSVLKFSASSHSPVSQLSHSLGMKRYFLNVGCARQDDHATINNDYFVCDGTKNIVHEEAMTKETLELIFANAHEFVEKIEENNLCLGEVGIGNTLSTTAMTALITDKAAEDITGTGSGISNQEITKKVDLIKKCLHRYNKEHHDCHPFTVLQSLGGIEIAWNAALILAAAKRQKTIILDGYITTISAVLAYLLDRRIKEHLMATHLSREPGHQHLLDFIGLKPFLTLDLALGQGFGAVLGFSFIQTHREIFRRIC